MHIQEDDIKKPEPTYNATPIVPHIQILEPPAIYKPTPKQSLPNYTEINDSKKRKIEYVPQQKAQGTTDTITYEPISSSNNDSPSTVEPTTLPRKKKLEYVPESRNSPCDIDALSYVPSPTLNAADSNDAEPDEDNEGFNFDLLVEDCQVLNEVCTKVVAETIAEHAKVPVYVPTKIVRKPSSADANPSLFNTLKTKENRLDNGCTESKDEYTTEKGAIKETDNGTNSEKEKSETDEKRKSSSKHLDSSKKSNSSKSGSASRSHSHHSPSKSTPSSSSSSTSHKRHSSSAAGTNKEDKQKSLDPVAAKLSSSSSISGKSSRHYRSSSKSSTEKEREKSKSNQSNSTTPSKSSKHHHHTGSDGKDKSINRNKDKSTKDSGSGREKKEKTADKSAHTKSHKPSSSSLKVDQEKAKKSKPPEAMRLIEVDFMDTMIPSPSSVFNTDSEEEDVEAQCRLIFDEFHSAEPAMGPTSNDDSLHAATMKRKSSSGDDATSDRYDDAKKKRVAYEKAEQIRAPVLKEKLPIKTNHLTNAMQAIYKRKEIVRKQMEEQKREMAEAEAQKQAALEIKAAALKAATVTALHLPRSLAARKLMAATGRMLAPATTVKPHAIGPVSPNMLGIQKAKERIALMKRPTPTLSRCAPKVGHNSEAKGRVAHTNKVIAEVR